MRNVCLRIAYDGTNYAGWQIQKNAKTLQEIIEKTLTKILNESIKVVASGRTDSGVHARAQVANFKTKKSLASRNIQLALNAKLPKDISVTDAKDAPPDFHSRFDAKSKLYRYTILNSAVDDPFLERYYCRIPGRLNVTLMKKEAKVITGKHDFKSFQSRSSLSSVKSTARTIKKVTVKREKDFIFIDIEADGFLHNMVRNIAGTLIEIGRGYFGPGSMKKIIHAKNRRIAGPTAPAKGLTLIKVKY